MRPLDEKETAQVFEKLFKFTGPNLKLLVERPDACSPSDPSARCCFRLHKNRVYYAGESLVRRATCVARPRLASLGTPIGRFTKSGSFRLTLPALDLLAAHARHRVWLKPSAEMPFLYGNSVSKSMLARLTDNTNPGDGVVVFSISDLPLGFGVAARSTHDCRRADAHAVVVHRQADAGEYLRSEHDLL